MIKKTPKIYFVLKKIVKPLFMLYYNPEIVYNGEIPDEGPVIIAGNHKHLYDQFFPIFLTKRGIHYLAKKEYFDSKKTSWFFKMMGCIPVDRSKKDPEAKEAAIEVLKDRGAIGIFPEGTRNKTEKRLLPFKFGAVSFSQKTNALIVPFAISGDYKFRSKNLKVKFGKPFRVKDMPLEEANQQLYDVINSLLD